MSTALPDVGGMRDASDAIETIRDHAQAALDSLYGLPGEIELPDNYEQDIERGLVGLLGLCRGARAALNRTTEGGA